MQVDIWSDIVCPWCAIGRVRFERALAAFPHADEIRLRYRSFELDPSAPRVRDETEAEYLAAKTGGSPAQVDAMIRRTAGIAADEGLTFAPGRAGPGNTFDAHRLLHLAAARGIQPVVKERFQTAYFADGASIGEPPVLRRLAVEAGLAEAEAAEVLAGDRYADAVRSDEQQARELGIEGVPFFVLDRRYGVSGAQSVDLLLRALEQAWSDRSSTAVAEGR